MGDDNLLFSTDYASPDCAFPEAVDTFLGLQDIPEASKRKILWDNAAKLFGITG
jgi:predicted TIM-barrel fold metal-dependent hydrolase